MAIKLLLVFLAGGLLSGIAQLLIDLTKMTPAKILVLYVSFGVLLFGIGAYKPLEDRLCKGFLIVISAKPEIDGKNSREIYAELKYAFKKLGMVIEPAVPAEKAGEDAQK